MCFLANDLSPPGCNHAVIFPFHKLIAVLHKKWDPSSLGQSTTILFLECNNTEVIQEILNHEINPKKIRWKLQMNLN